MELLRPQSSSCEVVIHDKWYDSFSEHVERRLSALPAVPSGMLDRVQTESTTSTEVTPIYSSESAAHDVIQIQDSEAPSAGQSVEVATAKQDVRTPGTQPAAVVADGTDPTTAAPITNIHPSPGLTLPVEAPGDVEHHSIPVTDVLVQNAEHDVQNTPVDSTAVVAATNGSMPQNAPQRSYPTITLIKSRLYFFNKVHVALTMPIDDQIQFVWENSIRARLRTVLLHEITSGTNVQELLMAGRKVDRLKPTVVVTCGNTKTRKAVERVFRQQVSLQELLRSNNMAFVAVIEPVMRSSRYSRPVTITTPTTKSEGISSLAIAGIVVGVVSSLAAIAAAIYVLLHARRREIQRQKLSHQLPYTNSSMAEPETFPASAHGNNPRPVVGQNVSVNLAQPIREIGETGGITHPKAMHLSSHRLLGDYENAVTFCGLPLQMSHLEGGTQHCTMGGLIMVGSTLMGITAGHSFLTIDRPSSADDSEMTNDQNDESSQEPFWWGYEDIGEDDDGDHIKHTVGEEGIYVAESNNTSHLSKGRETSDTEIRTAPAPSSAETRNQALSIFALACSLGNDWALLSLDHISHLAPNLIVQRGSSFDIPINTVIEGTAQGEVRIMFGQYAIPGFLRATISTLQLEGTTLDVQMVVLDKPLPVGSSGSWVVVDGQWCGHIVATRSRTPVAYMLPASAILQSIRAEYTDAEVRLPIMAEIDQRNTRTRQLMNNDD